MTKRNQALFAAAASTVCAIVWLVNCILDVAYGLVMTGQFPLHALAAAAWTACAVCWWLRAGRETRKSEC